MTQFSYSFCMAMLHSFWQAALIMLLYTAVDKLIHKNNAPLAKRNFLYTAITAQLVLFAVTFSIYFFDARGMGDFAGFVQNITQSAGGDSFQLITPWIFGGYLFIIIYRLIKAIHNWFHFKQQYKTGLHKPPVDLKIFTELKAYHFGIKRKVKLWISSSVNTPVTFGYFKPIILLPVTLLNNISTQQAETLILHELTHIRTNDYLLNWFLIVAETIFFFNPLVTVLCKKIRLEREKNCDINVMSFDYAPALYAETLLQAEIIKQGIPAFQLAAVNSKKQLLQRIQFFTSEKVLNQTMRFNLIAPLIGLALLLMLSTAVLFQSGNITLPENSAASLHYFPFNNDMVSEAETSMPINTAYGNNTADLKTAKQQTLLKKLPVVPVKIAATAINELQQKAAGEKTANPLEMNFALPVSITENDAARRIIVQEEGSGTASVKVYYLVFENGSWVLEPEWVITAKEIITDSIIGKVDSLKRSVSKFYPAQQ